jgi:hypothetical protein
VTFVPFSAPQGNHQLSFFSTSERTTYLAQPCKCGCAEVRIGSSTATHHARLDCTGCGKCRGWASRQFLAALSSC